MQGVAVIVHYKELFRVLLSATDVRDCLICGIWDKVVGIVSCSMARLSPAEPAEQCQIKRCLKNLKIHLKCFKSPFSYVEVTQI